MNKHAIQHLTITNRRLDELWLHVLYTCNLKCDHCLFSCSSETEEKSRLTLQECQKHVSYALAKGVKSIYITGGEPLLWSHLTEFLTWYYSLDFVVPLTILTNGTLIDDQKARFFSAFSSQGLNLRVSMECYTEKIHDRYRGMGSFEQAIQGIRNLNNYGIRPWVAFVNKSGGSLEGMAADGLETDFKNRLSKDFDLDIAGLKIIGAYSKGRFTGKVKVDEEAAQVAERLGSVQCNYGMAVSGDGIFPCPIIVDEPKAKLSHTLEDALAKPVKLDYEACVSCFATGSCCGA